MNHKRLTCILTRIFVLLFSLLVCTSVYSAKSKDSNKITPSELQSQMMSFADRFIGVVNGATIEYVLNTPNITTLQRALIYGIRLESTSAAVRIAAGVNPEVSLLDMVVLVSLIRYSMETDIAPNMLGSSAKVLVKAYQTLEKDIGSVAEDILSEEQDDELNELIEQWQKDNKTKVAIAHYRFSAFAKSRRLSTLVDKGDSGWFLANISEAKKEVERTRILAERTLYIAERQMTLIRWQVEQIFYELAMTPEFSGILNSTIDISQASQQLAAAMDTMPKAISAESGEIIKTFMGEFENERKEMIIQMFAEIAKERQAAINQASEQFVIRTFYVGSLLIIVFMISALLAALAFKHFSRKLDKSATVRHQV